MAYDEDLIALVDQRVRLHQSRTRAIGTCVSREVVGPGALVLFDGATVAVPVKVLGHVEIREGMRCTLDKYGSEWLVTGAFAIPQMGESVDFRFCVGTQTIAGSSFVDHPGFVPVGFTKYHDQTWVDVFMAVSGFATVAATDARWGLRFTQTDGETPYTPVDLNANYMFWSTANVRTAHSYQFVYAGTTQAGGIPAGQYSVQIRWRRSTGTGVVTNAGQDIYAIRMKETVRASSPYA